MKLRLSDISCTGANRLMIRDALDWFGMSHDSELDICESGQVYVGLTEICPRGSWIFGNADVISQFEAGEKTVVRWTMPSN